MKQLLTFLVFAAIAQPSSAGVILVVQDATIQEGGSTTVDVLISGTDIGMNFFGVQLDISGSIANGSLSFEPTANQPSPVSSTSPDYVFLGDSASYSAVRQDPVNTRLIAGDGTASTNDVTLGSTQKLLARLAIDHTSAGGAVGDTFQLAVTQDPTNTIFFNSAFQELTIDSTTAGTITVVDNGNSGASAVPEPSSLAMITVFGLGGIAARRHRRNRTVSSARA